MADNEIIALSQHFGTDVLFMMRRVLQCDKPRTNSVLSELRQAYRLVHVLDDKHARPVLKLGEISVEGTQVEAIVAGTECKIPIAHAQVLGQVEHQLPRQRGTKSMSTRRDIKVGGIENDRSWVQ